MLKSEIIEKLQTKHSNLSNYDIELILKIFFKKIVSSLNNGNTIEIRGFGSFSLNKRPARIGRNPKTGEKVHISEKLVPHFKAGKELRSRVDK